MKHFSVQIGIVSIPTGRVFMWWDDPQTAGSAPSSCQMLQTCCCFQAYRKQWGCWFYFSGTRATAERLAVCNTGRPAACRPAEGRADVFPLAGHWRRAERSPLLQENNAADLLDTLDLLQQHELSLLLYVVTESSVKWLVVICSFSSSSSFLSLLVTGTDPTRWSSAGHTVIKTR